MLAGRKDPSIRFSTQTVSSNLSRISTERRTVHGAAEIIDYNEAVREIDSTAVDGYGCASADQKDMYRMGKTQEMRRVFRGFSILSFTTLLMATWEFLLLTNTQGLVGGGRAGLFWSYIWTMCGFGLMIVSLAEMASMAPTCGAQYHWVSEFAPRHMQRFLSYVTGWLATLTWQANNASGTFIAATMLRSLVSLIHPHSVEHRWQGTVFVLPVMLFCMVFNMFLSRLGPMIQNIMMVVHVFAFCTIVVLLWVLAPHVDAKAALLTFEYSGGWSTMGLSLMVGQITAVYSLGASDSAAHMAEEVRDASMSVPRAMIGSFLLNGALGLVVLVTLIFSIPSVEDAINHPSGFPLLYVLNLSMPTNAVIGIFVLLFFLIMGGNLSCLASTARQMFAFARDQGLPFSSFIGEVCPTKRIPAKAVFISSIITLCLSFINIGSSSAFNALISLTGIAQVGTYGVSIACILHRRLTAPQLLPEARWSLGRLGVPINAAAVVYASFAFFWLAWPNTTPVNAENFNWASVVFVVAILCSLAYYFFKGRREYVGPVMAIKGYRKQAPPRKEAFECPFDINMHNLRFLSD